MHKSANVRFIPKVFENVLITRYKRTDAGHRFREGREVQIDLVPNTLLFAGTCTCFTHGTKTVGIIHKHTEFVFFFQRYYALEIALLTGHSENAFGNNQYATTGLIGKFSSTLELLLQAIHIVVGIYKAFTHMEAHAIYYTRM